MRPLPPHRISPDTHLIVANAAFALARSAESVALAGLEDQSLAPLVDLLTAAEAAAERWLIEHAPELAGDGRRRRHIVNNPRQSTPMRTSLT